MGSVTDLINRADFSNARTQAANLMNGNQDIQDALADCQVKQAALAAAVQKALTIANGN